MSLSDNETNNARLFPAFPNASPWVKDAIDRFVVHGESAAVNPDRKGTKVSPHYCLKIGPGCSHTVRLRLVTAEAGSASPFGPAFDDTVALRRQEADAFYASIVPSSASEDEARVMRQALAGRLWSKQYYYFNLDDWLSEHQGNFLRGGRKNIRIAPGFTW